MPRLPAAVLLVLFGTQAAALPPLEEVPAVRDGLVAAAIAYEIGRTCDGVDARLLRGVAFLEGLKGEARRLGYARGEIAEFIDDEAAKARLEADARAILRGKGAVPGDPQSYCAVGRAEIAAGSQIGRLLR